MQLQDPTLLRSQAYINGEWCAADSGKTHAVSNPANGEVIGQVADCGISETERAIQSADAALPSWRSLPAKNRSRILRRWFELMLEHKKDLALILSTEQGKPFGESLGEIIYAASFLEWFAEEAKRVYGDVIPSAAQDQRVMVLKRAIGVTAAITPWNFPSAMITRKAAPAIAAGCTVVLKPAMETPYSALALAELAHRAGVPAGVFNVVCGDDAAAIGKVLCTSPTVQKISFTGSTAVGKLLMQQSASSVKKVSMELGGHAPFIVFDDADIDAAVAGAMGSKFRNSGQTCICANRFIVQDAIYDAFATKLAAAAEALSVGPASERGSEQGPLINEAAVSKVQSHVDDAVAKGATILTGGKRHAAGKLFYEPTVLSNASTDMRITKEETFGPVAPIYRFSDEAEALALANDSEVGLAAYVYTRDIGRVWRVTEALEVGIVGVNEGSVSTEAAPFGGVKQSGIGREGSRYGIEEYVEQKYVSMGGL